MRYKVRGQRYFDYAQSDQRLRAGLVGHWVGIGSGPTLHDVSGHRKHGTLINGPLWDLGQGKKRHALFFDGTNDYVDAVENPIISTFPFTMCAWIGKVRVSAGFYYTIFNLASNTANRGWFNITARPTSPTNIRFGMQADNNDLGGGSDLYDDLTDYLGGDQYHHVVGVFASATDRRLYVDGRLIASRTGSVTFNAGIVSGNAWIGARSLRGSPAANTYFPGVIDDIRLYNRELFADEIALLARPEFLTFIERNRKSLSISGAASYTLALAQGAFTLAGQDLALTKQLIIQFAQGAYTLTGFDVLLTRGYTAVLEFGSFVLIGFDILFSIGYSLVLEFGSFVLTGFDLLFTKALIITLAVGSFVLTGISVALQASNQAVKKIFTFIIG